MQRRIGIVIILGLLLGGCASLGVTSPFGNDPLTGGVDSSTINLLQIPVPPGLQYFPSHSHVSGNPPEGVSTYRGNADQAAAAINLYNNLKQQGWNLRMYQRFGKRAIYIYEKQNRVAACVFYRQGMLTLLDVWSGTRLADNAPLTFRESVPVDEEWKSIAPEEYGPAESSSGQPATEERWGMQEREL